MLSAIAAGDSRVRFLPPVAPGAVIATLAGYDVTLVPSLWLETGPLVVYESFAAGVPVIGSDLGGIPEIVRDGVDGMLVRPGDVAAWGAALATVVRDRGRLDALRANVRPPRTMADAAREMAELYGRLVARVAEPALAS